MIEEALIRPEREKVQNIALAGGYGVGKSSILQKVALEHPKNVVQISLSTLGLSEKGETVGATSTNETSTNGSSASAMSSTNRIQKEIVKQLLYREDPNRTPGSRFRRIGRFHKGRGLFIAIIAAIVFTMVFFLTGWTDKFADTMKPRVDRGLWIHGGLLIFFTIFVYTIEFLAHKRIRIQSLQAGYATIALANDTTGTTYFDQYLDEIVYFFEVTKRDIVIFEDIDRFDNPHIFETLRALNTLLNNAEQLKRLKLNIRFIYAIKDSIFEELGDGGGQPQSSAATRGANRTKFFDLVVPVVPFITHRSARDLMKQLLSDIDHDITDDLIDLASHHITDMRLIKNIRNEFVIFRDRILDMGDVADNGTVDPSEGLKLSETSLFAMMIYKSTHLADFEKIQSGESDIDKLYADFRNNVTWNISRLRSKSANLTQELNNLDSVAARSERLGGALIGYLERLGTHVPQHHWKLQTSAFAGESWTKDDLGSVEFWRAITSGKADLSLTVNLFDERQGSNLRLNILHTDISSIVSDPLSAADWEESDREELAKQLQTIKEEIGFLSHANMHYLVQHEEYELSTGESLKQLTPDRLNSRIAQLLVTEGYIDQDFTLYTSNYYSERVSTRAQNFLIHRVSSNIMDPEFILEPADVEAILRERSDTILDEKSMYNISVLDHLLPADDERTDRIVRALAAFGADEREFLTVYLAAGQQTDRLLRRLTAGSDQTIAFLAETPELDHLRTQLLNEALSGIRPDRNYVVNDGLREFIEQNAAAMPIFTTHIDPERAKIIASLLVDMNVRFRSLSPLSEQIRAAVVEQNRYQITRENLTLALDGSENLALDQLLDADQIVCRYAISHLPDYLDALGPEAKPGDAIAAQKSFVKIITAVAESHPDRLFDVLALTAPVCQVERIGSVQPSAWPALVAAQRIPLTFENVTAYIESQESIDQPLADLLRSTEDIQVSESASEDDKENLAYMLLSALDVLSQPEVRVNLVTSLGLKLYLDPSKIQPETGHLTGLLIQENVIEDNAASFALASSLDWASREFAISQSDNFKAFVTPTEVPPRDVPDLMRSAVIQNDVKTVILKRVDEFLPNDDQHALESAASFATQNQEAVPFETVVRFARGGVEPQLVVQLLESHLPHLTEEQLAPLLRALGEPYATAAERNGKHPKFPHTPADLALVQKLEELNIVSSYDLKADEITVHMKKGARD